MTSKTQAAKKKERRNQGRSRNACQGVEWNGPWPTLPCGSAVKAPLPLFKNRLPGSGWQFSVKQFLTLARVSGCPRGRHRARPRIVQFSSPFRVLWKHRLPAPCRGRNKGVYLFFAGMPVGRARIGPGREVVSRYFAIVKACWENNRPFPSPRSLLGHILECGWRAVVRSQAVNAARRAEPVFGAPDPRLPASQDGILLGRKH